MKETLWLRLRRGVRRLRQRPDWPQFAGSDWADRIMDQAVSDRYHAKQGRTISRWVLEDQNLQLTVYLKRHYRLPRWRGLLAAICPDVGWSPAIQEWRHLQWAKARGLPVPAAVAAGEYIGPWGRLQSCLAVEELPDMLPLHEAVPAAASRLDARTFRDWKRTLAAEVARLIRALHGSHYFHKDLYLCHFYIPTKWTGKIPEWRGQVHLIDLHRLKCHRLTWPFWQMKDLAQLFYSSHMAGISARDRLNFWHAYLGPEKQNGWAAILRYGVLLKGQRYRRHNARKKGRA